MPLQPRFVFLIKGSRDSVANSWRSRAELYSVLDEDFRRVLKRPIAGLYSMSVLWHSNLISTQQCVFSPRSLIVILYESDTWLQILVFDVMDEINSLKLEIREDVDEITTSVWEHFLYTATVGSPAFEEQEDIAHVATRWHQCLGFIFC